MESQYFIRQGAKITGPVAAETVKKMAASGGLDRHDEVSRDGKKWSFAEEVPGLHFGGPASIDQPYYVFISYCPENQREADVLCRALEASRIPCWLASRDILPGVEAGEATNEALDASRIVVLLLSDQANQSPGVSRQIDRAAHKRRTIITFRLQNVLPRGSMEYYLSNTHWFDAFEGRVEEHAATLAGVIRRVLREEKLAGSDTQINLRLAETLREMPVKKRTGPQPSAASEPPAPQTATKNRRKLLIAASACAAVGILAIGLFFLRSDRSGEGKAVAQQPGPMVPVDPKPDPTRIDKKSSDKTSDDKKSNNKTSNNETSGSGDTPSNDGLSDDKPSDDEPSPPPSRPEGADTRTRWSAKRGYAFVKIDDKVWSERDSDDNEVHVCDEQARTESYVELHRRGADLGIRLFDGHVEFQGKKGRWRRVPKRNRPHGLPYTGSWE